MKQQFETSLICFGVAFAAIAGTGAETNAVLNIERIALFKNGLGYATATTTLPGDSRVFRLGQLPVPAYGTFWVGYGNKVKMRKLTTAMEPVAESVPVSGVDELLRLNPGMRVVLHLANSGSGEPAVVSGVVQPLPAARTNNEPPSPYFMDVRRGPERPPYYYGYPYTPPTGQQMVLVKTDRGIVALNSGSIQRAELLGDPVCVRTNEEKRPSISMELEAPAAGEKIAVSYLARGITWVPSYHIDLSDEKTARFSAQAQIINEMADLKEVQVELVTGFPNIQFPELPNPVAMSQTLAEFLRALAAGRAESGDRGGHMMMQQQALMMNNAAYASTPLPEYAIAANAQAAEDLFLYPLRKVSLKRGETATIPLLTADMPYRHLYTWKIADMLDGDPSRPLPGGRSAEEVWHTCRLVNAAKMPLTTAAAEFVKDGQFVGQDTCYYTVPGAEASIRINRAMNVQAEQAEMEVDRKRNAANFYGRSYDLVRLKGELKVCNRLAKQIEIEISKELSGEVLEKTGNPTDVPTARGLKQVNTKHQLTWLTKLAASEEQKFSYTYQLYISP